MLLFYVHSKHLRSCRDLTTLFLGEAQSAGHLTLKSGVLRSIPGLATYFRFSFRFSRRAVVRYWRKYVHEVLVNRSGGLSLPRKSVVRLTDRPDMTLDGYRGRKTTIQQQRPFETVFQSISDRLPERGRKKREVIDERKNVQTTPTRTYYKRNRSLPYYDPN